MSAIEYINSVVLTATSSTVTFDQIPDRYQDIKVIINVSQPSGTVQQARIRFNNDSTALYSITYLDANGSTIGSGRITGETYSAMYYSPSPGGTNPIISEIDILNYKNTNMYKTWLTSASNINGFVSQYVHLYRSTNAINRIDFIVSQGGAWNTGSTFTLWGVK